jgi:hypothetical protein
MTKIRIGERDTGDLEERSWNVLHVRTTDAVELYNIYMGVDVVTTKYRFTVVCNADEGIEVLQNGKVLWSSNGKKGVVGECLRKVIGYDKNTDR